MADATLTTTVDRAGETSTDGAGWRPMPGERAKRALDVAVCLVVLLPAVPVMALICLALLFQGWPLMYRQNRVGRGGREFPCLKFRTMVVGADAALERHLAADPEAAREWAETRKLRRDPRIAGTIGWLLRKTSLDELPQLLNVLAGDMSLVGPRPVVAAELVHYGEHLPHYMSVRPGLTGPWQVGGRSDTSYDTRVALDVHYVQNRSVGLDLAILARTVPAVIRAKGSR